ncbi:Brix-domain-containing protein [Polychaeton citri CBS 116435]|uniref:Brix-domain-containing protein n=1 Tax=Polychaeton citri CBS 116435 TaxID=1314669 RepID=A0A9P4UMF5_9PEZI|nr:Brix-domain-containing protein [Polychaeton citri CBS 116435]
MVFSKDPFRVQNKIKRQEQHVKHKKQAESVKRDERMRRKRQEEKNPEAREERRSKNVPKTIDSKRTWDQADLDEEGNEAGKLALSVDLTSAKRRKREDIPPEEVQKEAEESESTLENDEEVDSMLGSDSDEEEDVGEDDERAARPSQKEDTPANRAPSEAPSVATEAALTPDALASQFPTLFNQPPDYEPKVLITTAINSVLHAEAKLLTTLFPNSTYIKRTAHHYGYKYSVREICQYAANQDYTCVMVLNQNHHKRPGGLDIVHLPHGPMFHFSISNWVPGAKIPGHGNPTDHYPELILNGFRTPLGVVAAHLFKSLLPSRPEIFGRQVVTLHNQRDYIFVRRHRYVFRDKRGTEKSIQGADGKPLKGAEDIRAGLQELGPRFTLKLRRIDKGIQRMSGQQWEWKAGDEKVRTRFSL